MVRNKNLLHLIHNNFGVWLNNFSHLFMEFLKETSFPYKLVEIKLDEKTDTYFAKLQVAAKNIFFELPLQELIVNNDIIAGLAPLDVRYATYYACKDNSCPEIKIDSWILSDDQQEMLRFKIRTNKSIEVRTLDELLVKNDLINKLSSIDAYSVGYFLASKKISEEKNDIRNAKNNL